MQNKASITALMSAFARVFHSENDANPVFDDSLTKKLFTDQEYQAMKAYVAGGIDFFAPDKKLQFDNIRQAVLYIVNTQLAPTPLCRAAACEAALENAVMLGAKQYVILGAGLDTFAFRRPDLLKKIKVFEVDHPLTQKDKLDRITRAGLSKPENLVFAAHDFKTDDLIKTLIKAGFDHRQKSFFSWLGVSYYLEKSAIKNTLKQISEMSAEGSDLFFDYADENLFTATQNRVKNMLALANAGGEPMVTCFNYSSLEKTLEQCGFLIYELLTPDQIQNDIINSKSSTITAFEHINYVRACKKTLI